MIVGLQGEKQDEVIKKIEGLGREDQREVMSGIERVMKLLDVSEEYYVSLFCERF